MSDQEQTEKLSAELWEGIKEPFEAHQAAVQLSADARINFHEKLSVILAGSLALLVTLATALYSKPFSDGQLTHKVFVLIAISAALFWVGLVLSILHNFIETNVLNLQADLKRDGTVRKGITEGIRLVETDGLTDELRNQIRQAAEEPLIKKQTKKVWKIERRRVWVRWIGRGAVIAFLLGYAPVIVYAFFVLKSSH